MSNSMLEDFFNVKPKMENPADSITNVEFRPSAKRG